MQDEIFELTKLLQTAESQDIEAARGPLEALSRLLRKLTVEGKENSVYISLEGREFLENYGSASKVVLDNWKLLDFQPDQDMSDLARIPGGKTKKIYLTRHALNQLEVWRVRWGLDTIPKTLRGCVYFLMALEG